MKESQAWLVLAEEHDAGRTKSPFLCINLECPDLAGYRNDRLAAVPRDVRRRMSFRIGSAVGGHIPAYRRDMGNSTEMRQSRVLCCLIFSEIAKDEERRRHVG